MSSTPSPVRRSMLRILLAVAVIATVLPFSAAPAQAIGNQAAVSLSGVLGNHVDLGAGSTGLGANQFTLELWFKRTGAGDTVQTSSSAPGLTSAIPLITKGRSEADNSNLDVAYFFGIDSATGRLAADFEEGQTGASPGANHGFIAPTTVSQNVWHHGAVTYDGSFFRIYLDGVLDGTSPAINQPPRADSIHKVGVGTAFNGSGVADGAFQGQMDEVRIWNTARTQSQIQSAMNVEVTSGSGLTGRWGMNEGTGTTVAGSVGAINGTLVGSGATWAPGAPMLDPPTPAGNNAISLDGIDDAINLGAGGGSPLGATQFSLELWFKRTGPGMIASTGTGGITTAIPLITKGRSEGDGTNVDTNYFLGINQSTGMLAADFEDQRTTNNNNPVNGATVVTQNVWHHAAATFNGSQFCLYLDGVLDGTCTATTQTPRSDSIQIPAIGTAYDSAGIAVGRFGGQVDEARIWNVARTQAQIQASMSTPITSPTAGLLGRWAMNEGTGVTAANTAGTANVNGALVGGAAWVSGVSSLDPVDPPTPGGNNAILLDGVDDAINLGAGGGSPLGASQFTLELWFKQTGAGSVASTGSGGITTAIPLITKGRSENDASNIDTNYFLGINTATGALAADFEDDPTGGNHPVLGTTVITQNVWHHAAATFNGSQFCLYLDGVLDGTCATANAVPRSDSIQIPAIGTAYNSTGVAVGRFAGQVDEARIWSFARSQAQIQSAMNTEIVSQMQGLLGRWSMNEGSATTAANTAGSAGINGTLMGGATWVGSGTSIEMPPPPANYGVQFDGADDQIDMGPSSASALGASQYTLELWFKRTGTGLPAQTGGAAPGLTSVIPLITKGRSEADGTNVDINYFLGIDTASNKLATDFEEGIGGASPGINHGFIGNTVITNNIWHHAAVTYDGSVFRLFLDGALDGTSAPINQPPRSDSIHRVGIGVAYNSTGVTAGAFQGQIDEVRIWNAARSLAQIQGAMSSEITTGQANLLGRWGLNEGFWTNAGSTGGTVNGTLVNGPTWVAGTTFTPPNTAPVVDSVVIDQSTPQTNDTLTVTVTSHDPESDPVTYAYQWTKNGSDIAGATDATLDLSVAGNGDKDDLMRLRVTASDASLTSAPLTSPARTVQNSAPSATVSLDDHLPGTNATLTATATSDDADGDTVTLTYVWTVDGVVRQTTATTALTDTFDLSAPNNGGNGDEIIVTVTPNDGTQDGLPVADTANIGNAMPVVDSVTIDQADPLTGDTLSATVTSHDDDDDPLTTSYQWTKNGDDIVGATDPTLDLSVAGNGDKGDVIRVRVSVDDGNEASAPVTSDPIAIANTAPAATVALDSDSPGTNDTLTATASSADADGADTVTLTYLWTVNGDTVRTTTTTALSDALDLSVAGNGDNGDAIVVTVTPNDGTANGTGVSDTATVGNAAPVIASVTIAPADPGTNATVSATVLASDPDGPAPTISYQWTRNGSDISGETGSNLDMSVGSNGDKDDEIRVRVTASDGSATSAPVTSDPVTVANSAPTATVALDSGSPGTNDTLTATATSADADDDIVTLTYLWTVDGDTVKTTTTTALSDALDLSVAGNGDDGDAIVVTVTPNDGTVNGSGVADTATVGNSTPVVDAVSIDQTGPLTDDILSATVTSHDEDDDTLSTDYQWTLNGDDIAGGTDPTLDLSVAGNGDKGDVIRVRVNVSDGVATSPAVTSGPVTIGNTAPTATVSLDDHSPSTNATLTATAATSSDDDDDTVTLTYVWTVDGDVQQTTVATSTTDTFDLSVAGNGDNGDEVVVTVTPNDGEVDGAPASDTATVGNEAPTVDTVTIDQATPRTDDTLSVTVTSHDPDDNPITHAYQWTLNGVDIPGATGATLDLSVVGHGDKDDLIRVHVTASDGSATSAAVTSSPVTVLNTAPTATVELDDDSPNTNATLTATAARADADGDTVSLTYLWTVNGITRQTTTTTDLTDSFDLSLANHGNNGDTVAVTVTPNDGTANGSAASDSATVGNAAPVVDSVAIDQATPRTNDTLSATVTASDPDGGSPTPSYQWTRNGSDIDGATNTTLNLATGGNGDKDDLIRVRVTVSDGTATSGPLTSSPVTVINSAPTATVTLDSDAPGTNATLTATVTRSDADGDTVSLTYLWTVNGNTVRTTNTTALTDALDLATAGNGDPGDTIVVTVTPNDGTANGTGVSDTATVATGSTPPIFSDEFANLNNWNVTRITIDNAIGSPAAPSARAGVTGQSAFAYADLSTTTMTPCFSLNLNRTSGAADLFRLRTAAGGPIIKAVVLATGNLQLRSDFGGAIRNSGVQLGTGWHSIELCGTVGSNTTWDLLRDGVVIVDDWQTDTGTTPVGRVQIGDTASKTFTVNFDHVRLDLVPGEGGGPADTEGPTTPGTPTGSSPSNGTIQISWSASTDASPPITYRIYRDGNPASIGQTTSTTFSDPGLTPGTNHTYTVDAVDSLDNPSLMSGASASITVSGPPADTQGPTTPGTPTGSSPASGMIQIQWTASTDASPPITYRIYRDGNPASIGQTTSLTFMDPGLTPGTNHTYTVDAVDSLDNPSLMSGASASITVSGGATPPIFADDFSSGNLLSWTSFTRITIDNAIGSPAAPSARAGVTGQSAFAYADLSTTTMTPCFSLNLNRTSGAADLFRLRTAAGGPIIKAVVLATGNLQLRSDFGGAIRNSGVQLGTGWHSIELCGTVGSNTTWDLLRDGVVIVDDWQTDTGTTPVGRVQIGDTASKTFTVNFDHVRLDLVPGEGGGPADTEGPTTPGTPTGSSPSNGTIQISWSASTDASPPITYRIYRDGNPASIGQTTSTTFSDPGLTPGTNHTYTVDAVDSLDNPSLMSGASASITVSGPPADTQGPTTPGTPTGSSPASGMIQIQWTASTDASPPITYRIYRDGNPASIGQTTSLTFMDPGLTPGTNHTYTVDAVDSLDNPSLMSGASASITVSGGATPPIFADDFSSGNLLSWTSFTRITIDNAIGSPAAPSARAGVTGQSAFAYADLSTTTMTPCFSLNLNRTSGAADLFRLRTAAGGPIIKAVVLATGNLQLRSDFGGAIRNSGVQLGTGWHSIELCGTVGSNTTWDLLRDGVVIVDDWQTDTGTTPVGRVQIGDTASKTFTVNFDHVRLDLVVGG